MTESGRFSSFSLLSAGYRVRAATEHDHIRLKRPANPRNGKSALVSRPGGAATTDLIEARAGMPVMVIPIDAKLSGLDRSTPGFGKIMCLL